MFKLFTLSVILLSFLAPSFAGAEWWTQNGANVLSTNTGNGLAGADIHVAHCYLGTGTSIPCGGGASGITGSGATGQTSFFTGTHVIAGDDKFFWDNTNKFLGVGTKLPATQLEVLSTSSSDPRGIMSAQYSTDTSGARIHFRKARGTEAVPTTVVTGDTLGRLRFSGYDGSNFLQMASIDALATGTVASTRVPTALTFSTGTDATPSVLTERMRINSSGQVGVGTTSPSFDIDSGASTVTNSSVTFSGAGLNDMTLGGAYTGLRNNSIVVTVAGLGGVRTISSTPTAGGSGYTVDDIITITTGSGTATVHIGSIGGGGACASLSLLGTYFTANGRVLGTGYSTGAGQATSGGSGTGCTVNITAVSDYVTYTNNSVSVKNTNNYSPNNFINASLTLIKGLTASFGATSGHTVGNTWSFTTTVTGQVNAKNAYYQNGNFFASANTTSLYIGQYAGQNDTQSQNTLIGIGAGQNVRNSENVFVGYQAGNADVGGALNVIIGSHAGELGSPATSVIIGASAGNHIVGSTANNVFVGYGAGLNVTTAADNTFLGQQAGNQVTTNGGNVMIGSQAGQNSTSLENTFIGYVAGENHTTGDYNVHVGFEAGINNATGTRNNYFGASSGYSGVGASGSRNNMHGTSSGDDLTTGNDNEFFGDLAGNRITTGSRNIVFGGASGSNGSVQLVSANDSIILGYGLNNTASDQILIGGTGSSNAKDMYIGNGTTNSTAISTTLQVTGGSGADNVGGSLTIAGGKSTGAGTPGSIIFSTSDAAGSSSTLQTLTEKARIAGVSGHLLLEAGAGTVSVAINAGTASLASGSSDHAGKITANNTGASVITVTFAKAFSHAPACFANEETAVGVLPAVSTTTTLVITGATTSGDTISYGCLAY